MAKQFQAIRGMNDVLPAASELWRRLENTFHDILKAYDYCEIRLPIVEKTELFKRSIGEVTDIVEKEMYTFSDRNGDSLTLRPEGTAGCVRACIEHGLLHNQNQRLWYSGPMFRYEKPQKGRYRQFHQIGVEAYGMPGPDIDAELICISARLWQRLDISKAVHLQINSLGSNAARSAYREHLIAYFTARYAEMDEESKCRLHTNPLRILDSKNPNMLALLADAPSLMDYLDLESTEHFEILKTLLNRAGVRYKINPRLVRGLDYYCKTVFEWCTETLGAQGAVCAGGRYDGLVKQLGGKEVYGVGFAIGLERLVSMLTDKQNSADDTATLVPHVYLISVGDIANCHGLALAERLRDQLPDLRLRMNCSGGSFKSQFRRADNSGAQLALILGENEVYTGTVAVKLLRKVDREQIRIPLDKVADYLRIAIGTLSIATEI
jgi:histidyl-tRNA synthetase